MTDKGYTVRDLQELLHTSHTTIYRYLRRYSIPVDKTPPQMTVSSENVEKLLQHLENVVL